MTACERRSYIGRFVGLSLGSIVPTALIALFDPDPAALWSFFVSSFIFAHVIGWIAYTVVPWSWPLYTRLQAPWNWLYRFGVLLSVASGGTLLACIALLAAGWIKRGAFWGAYWMDLRIAALLTVIVGSAISVFENMRSRLESTSLELRTKELERERALKLATEARLSSLESRIHPHFLFNALNSISALIREDPVRAERLIERMAALLRFSLDSNQRSVVPLDHELKIVTDYLEIERARFGDRLRYSLDVDEAAAQSMVPPLSIQTLVENSVKFAIGPSRTGGEIRIEGHHENGTVSVAVSDPGPGFDLDAVPAGHGIDNLRSRLTALYGAAAKLANRRQPGSSSVTLSVPQP